eukprot:128280-Prymnesium_polylepis.1
MGPDEPLKGRTSERRKRGPGLCVPPTGAVKCLRARRMDSCAQQIPRRRRRRRAGPTRDAESGGR